MSIPTEDGLESIEVDVNYARPGYESAKTALIMHGMESSSEGVCSLRLSAAFNSTHIVDELIQ